MRSFYLLSFLANVVSTKVLYPVAAVGSSWQIFHLDGTSLSVPHPLRPESWPCSGASLSSDCTASFLQCCSPGVWIPTAHSPERLGTSSTGKLLLAPYIFVLAKQCPLIKSLSIIPMATFFKNQISEF